MPSAFATASFAAQKRANHSASDSPVAVNWVRRSASSSSPRAVVRVLGAFHDLLDVDPGAGTRNMRPYDRDRRLGAMSERDVQRGRVPPCSPVMYGRPDSSLWTRISAGKTGPSP